MSPATHDIVPVILSGGIGARLWPASRRTLPKQLLPLVEDRSMIRATFERAQQIDGATTPIIVTNADHADPIEADLGASHGATLIIEPVGRNTAPAVAVAAHEAIRNGSDPLLLILPSDHVITDEAAFVEAVAVAAGQAAKGHLVTFGITPDRAETGYGYISVGEALAPSVHRVIEFREKPDAETAAEYVASGTYLWNSGMFLFRASTFLTELRKLAADIAEGADRAWTESSRTDNRIMLGHEAFSAVRGESIDYAVMERTSSAAVVPTNPGWSDVGSWASLWEIAAKDDDGNVLVGDVLGVDVSGSYISANGRLVAVVGVDDIIVVDTPDALLVVSKHRAQDVKQVVDRLAADDRPELEAPK